MAYADLTDKEKQEIDDYWDLYHALVDMYRKQELWGLDSEEREKLEDLEKEMKERFDE